MNWTYEEFAKRLNKARVAIPPAFGAITAEQVELAMSDKEIPSQGPIAREKFKGVSVTDVILDDHAPHPTDYIPSAEPTDAQIETICHAADEWVYSWEGGEQIPGKKMDHIRAKLAALRGNDDG